MVIIMNNRKIDKYEIVYQDDIPVKVLRNGEEWRDIKGDNLIFSLLCKIDDLEENINNLVILNTILHDKLSGDIDE